MYYFVYICVILYLHGETQMWHKSIATRAITLSTLYCFKKLNMKLVIAYTHQDNISSQKVLRKNNFKLQGRLKKFFNNKKLSKDKLIFAKLKS